MNSEADSEKEKTDNPEHRVLPHAHAISVSQTNPQPNPKEDDSKKAKKHTFLEKFAVLIAILAFAAAAWQAYVASDNEQRSLRAYVSGSPNFIRSFDTSTYASINFGIVNHGTTPASNVSHSAAVDIFPYPLPNNFEFSTPYAVSKSRFVIFQTIPYTGNVTARRLFTQDEINAVVVGMMSRIYIYGVISYDDFFGYRHETLFCSSVVGSDNLRAVSQGTKERVDIAFEPCEQHNKAT